MLLLSHMASAASRASSAVLTGQNAFESTRLSVRIATTRVVLSRRR